MSSPVFTLSVPVDDPYRDLAAEVVAKYLEISGAGGPDREAFVASIRDAVNRLAAGGTDIDVEVRAGSAAVEVRLTCGSQATTLTRPGTPS
jgi:hypothetical protein